MIPFPFAEIEPVAAHVRNLGYFAWKPIVIQVGFFFPIKKISKFFYLGCPKTFRDYHLW
jgi:hypothetical protein